MAAFKHPCAALCDKRQAKERQPRAQRNWTLSSCAAPLHYTLLNRSSSRIPLHNAVHCVCLLPKGIPKMDDTERRTAKRSRFDQTEPEPKRASRFDRRSRSPPARKSEPRRSRSPLGRTSDSPSTDTPKSSTVDPAAAAGMENNISRLAQG